MLDSRDSSRVIRSLFRRVQIANMDQLFQVLQTNSRMSVFRRLRDVGYRSSYTHAGRYYTLDGIPAFDEHGLWFHQGVGFSRYATLKATIMHLVADSDVGQTHGELVELLRTRVQNAVLGLVREQRINRHYVEKMYLYVSADEARAMEQIEKRQERLHRAGQAQPLASALVIEVLIEVVQASEVIIAPSVVAGRLCERGLAVSVEQVERVYREHSLESGKKTADSRRSRT